DRHERRILDQLHRAVGLEYAVLDARNGSDEIEIELALEPLLHDLHVQQSEKSAAKAEAERGGSFRLIVERRVVELQLVQRVAQVLVLRRVGWIDTGEHHRVDVLIPWQRLDFVTRRIEYG